MKEIPKTGFIKQSTAAKLRPGAGMQKRGGDSGNLPVDVIDVSKGKDREKEWTILIYSSATADIDDEALKSARDMEKTGSGKDVSVILQRGRNPSPAKDSWRGVRRYYITRNTTGDGAGKDGLTSPVLENLGSVFGGVLIREQANFYGLYWVVCP